jgi:hypothetical protein
LAACRSRLMLKYFRPVVVLNASVMSEPKMIVIAMTVSSRPKPRSSRRRARTLTKKRRRLLVMAKR